MRKVPRPYQNDGKRDIYSAWECGHRNVLYRLPTGMGKTVLFSSITIDMAIEPRGPKFPTVILVHRKELVQQISLTLAEEGCVHNIIAPRNVILGIIAAHRQLLQKNYYDHTATVTVVSVDTFNARIKKLEKWAKTIRLWICDEATHLLQNNKWGKATAAFPNAIGLGVTATPERLDKRGLGRHADGIFDTMVEGPSTAWGIENGFLCDYQAVVPPSNYRKYLKDANAGSDFTHEAMVAASNGSNVIGDAVKTYLEFAPGKQAIYFADSIETATKMEAKFNAGGVVSKLLTGETPDSERLKALIDFRKREIQNLINVDLFDEGLDVPGIEVVGMCRPTMSLGKYLQMVGRGLRPAKGKKHLILIDHVGNISTHLRPDAPRYWTLDRIIKRRDRVNLLRNCSNPRCNAPYDRFLTDCPYCGFEAISQGGGGGAGGGKPALDQVDGDLMLIDSATLRMMEKASNLEDPANVARRVSNVAGAAAGLKAMEAQKQRIATQAELVQVIAAWAGYWKNQRLGDRQLNKKFYLENDMTITQALSEPREDMLRTIEDLQGRFR